MCWCSSWRSALTCWQWWRTGSSPPAPAPSPWQKSSSAPFRGCSGCWACWGALYRFAKFLFIYFFNSLIDISVIMASISLLVFLTFSLWAFAYIRLPFKGILIRQFLKDQTKVYVCSQVCVKDVNNITMDSDISLEIPSDTVVAYSIRELEIKKNGHYGEFVLVCMCSIKYLESPEIFSVTPLLHFDHDYGKTSENTARPL